MTDEISKIEQIEKINQRLVAWGRGLDREESLMLWGCLVEYAEIFPLIEAYDQGRLATTKTKKDDEYVLTTETAQFAVEKLKKHLSTQHENVGLFGAPNAGDIDAVISNLYQTGYGRDLYPDVETKAANLLYLLVKDHCFVDGNKRIAAFLFAWFLAMNNMLYVAPDNQPIVPYALLYKLTVFIAKSDPKHKDVIIDLISNIISFPSETPPEEFWSAHAIASDPPSLLDPK